MSPSALNDPYLEYRLDDINLQGMSDLPSPEILRQEVQLNHTTREKIWHGRRAIHNILMGKDPRKIIVVGPCSIHDPAAALEYAERLKALAHRVQTRYLIVMRVYFEKPRSVVGWKGLINDPFLDDSFRIEDGLRIARELLRQLNEMGLPCAGEALDPIIPQYLSDLYSWCAIGARTSESQTHREMASGLSMSVGIKNGTDGNLEHAINALLSVGKPHRFLGIQRNGKCCIVHTRGHHHAHLILRGGTEPNYDEPHIQAAEKRLQLAGLLPKIMVDCSHGNSCKDPKRQPEVFREVMHTAKKQSSIIGCMLESHLNFGNQPMAPRHQLQYGVSITDACMDWSMTESLILESNIA